MDQNNNKNELATAGMVCSLLGFLGLTALYGVILSFFGFNKSKELNGVGRKESILGIIVGLFFLFVFVLALAYVDEDQLEYNDHNNTQIEEKTTITEEKSTTAEESSTITSDTNNQKIQETITTEEPSSSTPSVQSTEKFTYTVDNEYNSMFSYYIEGTVKNNRDTNYTYVSIEFICYDSAGNNLGTAFDNTNYLLGNQTWKYKAMFLGDNESVSHCDFHKVSGF